MTEALTLYKLMILYMLKRVNFPLAMTQFTDFILGKGYTTYFKLQESMAQLIESNLVEVEENHRRTLYHLTPDGARTIHFLISNISPEIRNDIDAFLKEKEYDLSEDVAVRAKYYLNTDQKYEVRCQLLDGPQSLVDLKLTVPTKKEAESIANNWTSQSQEIYAALLAKLL
ncbi:MAG: DUF4364 family protein [Ruminococcus sp.]|jgi:predicted transcriptional regulator|nr:DUF4364 family protein [Ruminococcus sp.]